MTILNPSEKVDVSYFTKNGTDILYTGTDEDKKAVTSIRWIVPFGQELVFNLPNLTFELEGDALPLQLSMGEDITPQLRVNWCFNLAFGFDEDDGE